MTPKPLPKEQRPERFVWDEQDVEFVALKFDPNQPRAPAGTAIGGQWVSGSGFNASAGSAVFEIAPNPNDKELTERWEKLSPKQKIAASKAVLDQIAPKVAEELGLTKYEVVEHLGGWMGYVNPSYTMKALTGVQADAAARMLGHALKQDGMMLLSGKPFPGSFPASVVGIQLHNEGGRAAKAIYSELSNLKKADGSHLVQGFTMRGNRMEILHDSDYTGLSDKAFAKKVADTVDKAFNAKYGVAQTTAHAAFLGEGDYTRAPDGLARGVENWRGRADSLRTAAQEALEKELRRRRKEAGQARYTLRVKYDPNQPRLPAGQAGGGRFTEWGSAGLPGSKDFNKLARNALRRFRRENPRLDPENIRLEDLNAAIRKGADFQHWKDWYSHHKELIVDAFGPKQADVFEKFLAAGSIQTTVKVNTQESLDAFAHYLKGGRFDDGSFKALGSRLEQYQKIAEGGTVTGPKLTAFLASMQGDADAVAMDRHMRRILFKGDGSKGKTAQIRAGTYIIRDMAKHMGWEARQVQAVLWIGRLMGEGSGVRATDYRDELLARRDQIDTIQQIHGFTKKSDKGTGFEPFTLAEVADAYDNAALLLELIRMIHETLGTDSPTAEQVLALFDESAQKYDPNQPRHPAGSAQGGQWAANGSFGFYAYISPKPGGQGEFYFGNRPDGTAPPDGPLPTVEVGFDAFDQRFEHKPGSPQDDLFEPKNVANPFPDAGLTLDDALDIGGEIITMEGVYGPQVAADFHKQHSATHARYRKDLSGDRKFALDDYQTDSYRDMNLAAATGTFDGRLSLLDQTIAMAPGVPEGTKLYRAFRNEYFAGNAEDYIGYTFREKGYLSASVSPRMAKDWAGAKDDPTGLVVLRMHTPAKTQGLYLGNPTNHQQPYEYEALLPRNTEFTIQRVKIVEMRHFSYALDKYVEEPVTVVDAVISPKP